MEAIDLARGEKKHRASKTGVKARKKEDNRKKKLGISKERYNPKAFSVANIVRTKRNQQRNLDRAQKKELVPLVDRSEEVPPPALIVVMGPPKCGKSTLIRSLVKIYSNQNLTDVLGPITVVAGKKKRFTFFECPQDIHSMTDLAKVADLVLLMVDASYGFEMETFEYLNLLQLHGFPKVLGILTNLDKFKMNKTLQKTKKNLKHRFWTEIYKGAKMFDFTGVVNNKYLKHEVKRLTLHLNRVKFRPLVWRNTHPFVMVDRVEDVTLPTTIADDPTCDRDIVLFGYVRGTHLKPSMRIHLIGVGDFDMHSVTPLSDPCSLPYTTSADGKERRTNLKLSKDSLLYAPMANVGRVKMDRDGTYIELSEVHYTKPEHLDLHSNGKPGETTEGSAATAGPAGLLKKMQDISVGVDHSLRDSRLSMFASSRAVQSSEVIDDERSDDMSENESEIDDDDDEDNDEEVDEEDEEGEGGSFAGESDYDSTKNSEEEDSGDDSELEEEDRREEEDAGDAQWKRGMSSRAQVAYESRVRGGRAGGSALMQKVYGSNWTQLQGDINYEELDADNGAGPSGHSHAASGGSKSKGSLASLWDEEEDTQTNQNAKKAPKKLNSVDSSRIKLDSASLSSDWTEDDVMNIVRRIRNKFVTGDWANANKVTVNGDPSNASSFDGDEEIYGDFEDLETGQVFNGKPSDKRSRQDDKDSDSDSESDENESGSDSEADNDAIDEELRQMNARRKAASHQLKLKAEDDDDPVESRKSKNKKGLENLADEKEADALERQIEAESKRKAEQNDRNRTEFGEEGAEARLRHEGLRQGLYVRIALRSVPSEFCSGFRPELPLVLGGLQPHESAMGIIHARVKRHRWHKRILKCNDPLIFSIGWRRFQSIPVYAMEDDTDRKRYLKYTPEHMHCLCAFYGPLVPPNTGILAYQKTDRTTAGFRIALTGTALEMSASISIVKKLKLVGTPTKIYKNTAFVKGMFNTALEVAKFEGSKLKTVSGIRGQIKKAVKGDAESGGSFRATFEDKILMSDIVFCRVWVPVEVKRFYNPVTSLLRIAGQTGDGISWQGVRPVAQIRRENSIPIPVEKDSVYKPIVRVPKVFKTFSIPKKLQEALPFASKPKQDKAKNRESYLARRAVIIEPEDRKKRALVQMLSTIKASKTEKRHAADQQRAEKRGAERLRESSKFTEVHREEKKRKYSADGKRDSARESKKQRSAR